MTARDDLIRRSKVLSERIRQRTDVKTRKLVDEYAGALEYAPVENLMISQSAWEHVTASGIEPRQVFAHPDLLQRFPEASLYYRGLALLPRKRMRAAGAVDVKNWENRSRVRPVSRADAKKVCRLYNSVISSIIEGTAEWTLDNGYRNIMSNSELYSRTRRGVQDRDVARFRFDEVHVSQHRLDGLFLQSLGVRAARRFHLARGHQDG